MVPAVAYAGEAATEAVGRTSYLLPDVLDFIYGLANDAAVGHQAVFTVKQRVPDRTEPIDHALFDVLADFQDCLEWH